MSYRVRVSMQKIMPVIGTRSEAIKLAPVIKEMESHPKEFDVVVVTAESLCEKAKKYNSKVYYLPNAVDYEHFAKFKGKEPKEYQLIKSPRIIYVGSLSEWIDVSILKEIALKLPDFF